MIGHLQRNKVDRTLPLVAMIHSVDSLRLAEAVDSEAGELGRVMPVLLEVNVSGEAAKLGFAPVEIEPLLPKLVRLKNVEIRGLMCIAGLAGGDAEPGADLPACAGSEDHLQNRGRRRRGAQ